MSNIIQLSNDLPVDFPSRKQILQSYINSKLLPAHIRTVEQAEVIVGIGREIGLQPIAAMRTIHLINGTPTVSPAMMLALANKRKLIEDQKLEKMKDRVVFTIKRVGRATPHREEFGLVEATALGLIAKDNYKKQPMTMYAWRAISAAMRIMFPDVIFGLYTPEEIGANVEIDPENELDIKAIKEGQMPPDIIAQLESQVETIKERLAAHCGGDVEQMNSMLIMLTEHKDPQTQETKFVELAELDSLIKKNPKWIPAILSKLDRQRIGIVPPPQLDNGEDIGHQHTGEPIVMDGPQ